MPAIWETSAERPGVWSAGLRSWGLVPRLELQQRQCQGFRCLQKRGNALIFMRGTSWKPMVKFEWSQLWIRLYPQSCILKETLLFLWWRGKGDYSFWCRLAIRRAAKDGNFLIPFLKTSERADLFFSLFCDLVLLHHRDYLGQRRHTLNRFSTILKSLGIPKLPNSENCIENIGFGGSVVSWSFSKTGCSAS